MNVQKTPSRYRELPTGVTNPAPNAALAELEAAQRDYRRERIGLVSGASLFLFASLTTGITFYAVTRTPQTGPAVASAPDTLPSPRQETLRVPAPAELPPTPVATADLPAEEELRIEIPDAGQPSDSTPVQNAALDPTELAAIKARWDLLQAEQRQLNEKAAQLKSDWPAIRDEIEAQPFLDLTAPIHVEYAGEASVRQLAEVYDDLDIFADSELPSLAQGAPWETPRTIEEAHAAITIAEENLALTRSRIEATTALLSGAIQALPEENLRLSFAVFEANASSGRKGLASAASTSEIETPLEEIEAPASIEPTLEVALAEEPFVAPAPELEIALTEPSEDVAPVIEEVAVAAVETPLEQIEALETPSSPEPTLEIALAEEPSVAPAPELEVTLTEPTESETTAIAEVAVAAVETPLEALEAPASIEPTLEVALAEPSEDVAPVIDEVAVAAVETTVEALEAPAAIEPTLEVALAEEPFVAPTPELEGALNEPSESESTAIEEVAVAAVETPIEALEAPAGIEPTLEVALAEEPFVATAPELEIAVAEPSESEATVIDEVAVDAVETPIEALEAPTAIEPTLEVALAEESFVATAPTLEGALNEPSEDEATVIDEVAVDAVETPLKQIEALEAPAAIEPTLEVALAEPSEDVAPVIEEVAVAAVETPIEAVEAPAAIEPTVEVALAEEPFVAPAPELEVALTEPSEDVAPVIEEVAVAAVETPIEALGAPALIEPTLEVALAEETFVAPAPELEVTLTEPSESEAPVVDEVAVAAVETPLEALEAPASIEPTLEVALTEPSEDDAPVIEEVAVATVETPLEVVEAPAAIEPTLEVALAEEPFVAPAPTLEVALTEPSEDLAPVIDEATVAAVETPLEALEAPASIEPTLEIALAEEPFVAPAPELEGALTEPSEDVAPVIEEVAVAAVETPIEALEAPAAIEPTLEVALAEEPFVAPAPELEIALTEPSEDVAPVIDEVTVAAVETPVEAVEAPAAIEPTLEVALAEEPFVAPAPELEGALNEPSEDVAPVIDEVTVAAVETPVEAVEAPAAIEPTLEVALAEEPFVAPAPELEGALNEPSEDVAPVIDEVTVAAVETPVEALEAPAAIEPTLEVALTKEPFVAPAPTLEVALAEPSEDVAPVIEEVAVAAVETPLEALEAPASIEPTLKVALAEEPFVAPAPELEIALAEPSENVAPVVAEVLAEEQMVGPEPTSGVESTLPVEVVVVTASIPDGIAAPRIWTQLETDLSTVEWFLPVPASGIEELASVEFAANEGLATAMGILPEPSAPDAVEIAAGPEVSEILEQQALPEAASITQTAASISDPQDTAIEPPFEPDVIQPADGIAMVSEPTIEAGTSASEQKTLDAETTINPVSETVVAAAAVRAPQPQPAFELPDELAFLRRLASEPGWNYRSHMDRFSSDGLTFTFEVLDPPYAVEIPLFGYDRWRDLLAELDKKDLVTRAERKKAESLTGYQRFAMALPALQRAGLYVDPEVRFTRIEDPGMIGLK